jgi:predicted ester cyclase
MFSSYFSKKLIIMAEIKKLRKWYDEVWHNGNEIAIEEILAEHAIIHGLETDKSLTGASAFLPFYKNMRLSFPKISVELFPIVEKDGIEVAYCHVTATSQDGQQATFSGISAAKFENDKLVEGWNGFDFLSMYQQLGFKLEKTP